MRTIVSEWGRGLTVPDVRPAGPARPSWPASRSISSRFCHTVVAVRPALRRNCGVGQRLRHLRINRGREVLLRGSVRLVTVDDLVCGYGTIPR